MELLPIVFLTLFLSLLLHFLLLRSLLTLLHFRRQSISGPIFVPFVGNLSTVRRLLTSSENRSVPLDQHHLIPAHVLPHFHLWRRSYGPTYLFWHGSSPRLFVSRPDLVRQITLQSSSFSKVSFNPLSRQLFGEGLVGLNGEKWALHRKVASPAFSMERVKSWVPEMGDAVMTMLERWERKRDGREQAEVEVHKELHLFTAEVIARVAFGSSYEEGKRVFQLQEEQMQLVIIAFRSVYIPGFRFLPTKRNRRRKELNEEIRKSIRKMIEAKDKTNVKPKNLIELMLASNKGEGEKLGMEEIIDECKTFYFAGKETTANLLTWALYLLSLNLDWQGKCREEVLSVLGDKKFPSPDDISNLRLVSLVLNEALRLYPPVVAIRRVASQSTKLGSISIPAGTEVLIPCITINQDVEIWGEDASQFNPLRFANSEKPVGVFFPFGYGPSICIGQTLALIEAKVAMAMILQRYLLSVSPSYVHAPMVLLTLQPLHGVQLLIRKL